LLLIRQLSTTYGHPLEECLYFGEREWIAFEDARVPYILREHPMKAEHHTLQ
jgi:hypothetical protein